MNLASYKIDWNEDFNTGFAVLPEGNYAAKITKSEIKQTNAKNGSYVSFELSLLGGKGVKNRKLFNIHMLEHPNPTVVNIGLGQLKELATLLGLNYEEIQDTSDFHDKEFGLELAVGAYKNKDGNMIEQNTVKKYFEFDESLLEGSSSEGGGVF